MTWKSEPHGCNSAIVSTFHCAWACFIQNIFTIQKGKKKKDRCFMAFLGCFYKYFVCSVDRTCCLFSSFVSHIATCCDFDQPIKLMMVVVQFLQVLVRFPTGERKERRFHNSAAIQSIYDYVDSLDCLKVEKYSLVSNFPRVVYGPEKLSLSLKEAGFHPQASLFVEVDS